MVSPGAGGSILPRQPGDPPVSANGGGGSCSTKRLPKKIKHNVKNKT